LANGAPRRAAIVAKHLLDAQGRQTLARQPRQVSPPFAGASLGKQGGRSWVVIDKNLTHFVTHLEGLRSYARPQPRYYFSS
jgi:hypothetical protein